MRELRPRKRSSVALVLIVVVAVLSGCTESLPGSDDAIGEEPLVFLRGAGQGPPPDPAVLDSNDAIASWLASFEEPLRTHVDEALARGIADGLVTVGWAPTGCLEDRATLLDNGTDLWVELSYSGDVIRCSEANQFAVVFQVGPIVHERNLRTHADKRAAAPVIGRSSRNVVVPDGSGGHW